MEDNDFHPEHLRPVAHAFVPDPRSISFVRYDSSLGGMRPLTMEDHHQAVCGLILHPGVPEDITIQFETAKNLYLYAWIIYRFFPVAEHQSLACLEYGLRERFGERLPKEYLGRGGRATLKPLLRYARDHGYIKNEGFRRWHDGAQRRAEFRYSVERAREMRAKGLTSITLNYSDAVVADEDRKWNLINDLIDFLPEARNAYAHGSGSLHRQVRGTIELVYEILNQIFQNNEQKIEQ